MDVKIKQVEKMIDILGLSYTSRLELASELLFEVSQLDSSKISEDIAYVNDTIKDLLEIDYKDPKITPMVDLPLSFGIIDAFEFPSRSKLKIANGLLFQVAIADESMKGFKLDQIRNVLRDIINKIC